VHLFLIKGKYQVPRMLVHDIIGIDIFIRYFVGISNVLFGSFFRLNFFD